MKAIKIKNWCLENITPQSWSRIVLKKLPQLRSQGFELHDMENPSEDLELSPEVMAIIEEALVELYELSLDEQVIG